MMLLAMLFGVPALVTLPPGAAPAAAICRNPGPVVAKDASDDFGLHTLGDQPPAQHILAVLRTDFDGCVKPVVVNPRVGKR